MQTDTSGMWGRASHFSLSTFLSTLLILLFTPFMVFYFYISCVHYQGSLLGLALTIFDGNWGLLFSQLPPFEKESLFLCAGWILLQLILALSLPDLLHRFLPGYRGGLQEGAPTPAGIVLKYQINGLQAYLISHLLFFSGAYLFNLFSPAIIAQKWGSLLWVANGLGYLLAIFVYIKAYLFPTEKLDRKFSGNFLYDFYMGIEFNPRIGPFDFKLFFNGRLGIIAWTLINFSFGAQQYATIGYVTNSMILLNILQAIYVIDFFWHETWYLKTIDICHDHFGWMLSWGNCVWLPYMYTLQGLYLLYHPIELSTSYALFVFLLGLSGYAIFRSANNQKDLFRREGINAKIWGKNAHSIPCSYTAADNKEFQSQLLISGWWGKARHFNYTGDLMFSLSTCLCCGFESALPYFYAVYMMILLVHRCLRCEKRCKAKYGKPWEEYEKKVPYRLIPGFF